MAEQQNQPKGYDLAGGDANPMLTAQANYLTERWQLQKQQRTELLQFVTDFVRLLTGVFVLVVMMLVGALVFKAKFEFDWHFLLLGTSLIVPPSVLLFLMTSRVFSDGPFDSKGNKPDKDKEESETPLAQVLETSKELVTALGEAIQKIGSKG